MECDILKSVSVLRGKSGLQGFYTNKKQCVFCFFRLSLCRADALMQHVEDACSDMLMSPNWTLNMQIVDELNQEQDPVVWVSNKKQAVSPASTLYMGFHQKPLTNCECKYFFRMVLEEPCCFFSSICAKVSAVVRGQIEQTCFYSFVLNVECEQFFLDFRFSTFDFRLFQEHRCSCYFGRGLKGMHWRFSSPFVCVCLFKISKWLFRN